MSPFVTPSFHTMGSHPTPPQTMPLPSSINIMTLMSNPLAVSLLLNTPRKGGFAGAVLQANKMITKIRIKQEISGLACFMPSTLFLSQRGGNWKNRKKNRMVLDCGGKRSATPLLHRSQKRLPKRRHSRRTPRRYRAISRQLSVGWVWRGFPKRLASGALPF